MKISISHIIKRLKYAISLLFQQVWNKKSIVIVLHDKFNLLEVAGFYQPMLLLYQKGYKIKFVAPKSGLVNSATQQPLYADFSIQDINSSDILFIPSSVNNMSNMIDSELKLWVNQMSKNSKVTVALDSGYLLVHNSINIQSSGSFIGKGVSAAIDIALEIITNEVGEAFARTTQLSIEYDPSPLENTVELNPIVKNEIGINKDIIILLYNGFTMLDLIGPFQIFHHIKEHGYNIKFVAKNKGRVKSDDLKTSLFADYTLDEITNGYLLFIPGSLRTYKVLADIETIEWIKQIDKTTTYSTSVCTGSLLYGKANLLINRKASTHWYAQEYLAKFGAIYQENRFTKDGKYMTGAGVTSGIDLALNIVSEIIDHPTALDIQNRIGYLKSKIYEGGSLNKSNPSIIQEASKVFDIFNDKY